MKISEVLTVNTRIESQSKLHQLSLARSPLAPRGGQKLLDQCQHSRPMPRTSKSNPSLLVGRKMKHQC